MIKFVEGTDNKVIITSDGRVFRRYPVCRNHPERGFTGFREVKPRLGSGYLQVNLGRIRNTALVHRLVAKAFISNPLGLRDVDHIDGNKTNNRVENLRWVTHKENCNNPNTRHKCVSKLKNSIWTDIVATDKQGNEFRFRNKKEAYERLLKGKVGKGCGACLLRCFQKGGYAYGYFWTAKLKEKQFSYRETFRRAAFVYQGRIYRGKNKLQELCKAEGLDYSTLKSRSKAFRESQGISKIYLEIVTEKGKVISENKIE